MTPYKLFLAYFNKLNEEAYKKKLKTTYTKSLKIDNCNDKTIIMTNYVKKKRNFF